MRLKTKSAQNLLPLIEADLRASKPRASSLRKAKRSDVNVRGLDSSDSDSDDERAAAQTARRSWALVAATALLFALGLFLAAGRTAGPKAPPAPPAAGRALRESAKLFRKAAAADGLRGREFVHATAALYPFLDALGLGLRQMVHVNAKTAPPVEALVAEEVAAGTHDADDGVAVAVLWNGRILALCEKLVRDVLAAPSLKTDARPMGELAAGAYRSTLAAHHNWVLRSAAQPLLRLAPDRRTLLEDRLGYPEEAWDGDLRRDLSEFQAGLSACLDRLRALFRDLGEAI